MLPLTAIIITKNEETGIARVLERLVDFDQIVVVDSNSTDRTAAIAEALGAEVINFEWNGQYPKKKQWSLDHEIVRNRWVLLLDGDEYPSRELIEELRSMMPRLEASSDIGAYDIPLRYRFAGAFLRHGHTVSKRSLIDREATRFPTVDDLAAPGIREVEGHYQPQTQKLVGILNEPLHHDDRDPVSSWFDRHNRYSDWEAYLNMHPKLRRQIADNRSRKGRAFDRIPFKPLVFFLYSYLIRNGFRDGRPGFDYAFALSAYYWQIGVKTRELQRSCRNRPLMRVLHVIPSVARTDGGPSEVIRGWLHSLSAHGVAMRVLTTDKGGTSQDTDVRRDARVCIVHALPPKRFAFSPALALRLLAGIRSADLIHVHSIHSFSFYDGAVGFGFVASPRCAAAPWSARRISLATGPDQKVLVFLHC
ncbi:glycosyltransferase [Curtobacterium flaccumfaciens]|nr:glycosyltransferase [Curtobacterium flaccumfaciens]